MKNLMKRRHGMRAAACVFTSCVLLFTAASGLAATVTFTLNIPARAPSPPVAKVKITLELSSPPDALTQLSIDGLTTGFPGALTLPRGMSTPTDPNTDDVLCTVGAGNTVIIFYTPFSRFTPIFSGPTLTGYNLCTLKPTVTEAQNVAIRFTGPTITGFRINSYTVASTFDCGQSKRRVKSNAAVLSPAPAGATFKGRHPLDVILVLDKSGSMAWLPPGPTPGTDSRWKILNDALGTFVALWEQADATLAGGGGADLAKDRLGLAFFSSST